MPPRTTSVRVTWWEFALRLGLAFALIGAADVALRHLVRPPQPIYDAVYRLPGDGSLDELGPFIARIQQVRAAHPRDLIVVFLGASPAYGVGIKNPKNTFSAAFESAAKSDTSANGRRVRAYNLASNGLLLGDQYVIAKALPDVADLIVVQLTYQTLDPKRGAATMREPDLPSTLHVNIDADEARALGTERRTETALDRTVDRVIRPRWFALRYRAETAAALSLDDVPVRLYQLAAGDAQSPADPDLGDGEDAVAPAEVEAPATAEPVDPTTPFDELDPALQTVAISRAGENSNFELTDDNGELGMLRRLGGLLDAREQRAVFFMAPMNEEVIAAYEVLDEAQYARNLERLRATVEHASFPLIDYHTEPFLTSADFVDLTHTTDSGGAFTGARLWKDLRSTIESTPAR